MTADASDPWRGIRRGDRFYLVRWNSDNDAEFWYEVTDLWFDPVRGQNSVKRGYVVAIRLMGRGTKWVLAASTLAGKSYRRVDLAEAQAAKDADWLIAK